MSFIQQHTAPHCNTYHALLSVQESESESLEGLINRVDEHIRTIKSLSPSSFTLAIIRALPHSFDDAICTISVLDKFDKQSVIQSLRKMDQTRSNLSGTSTAFSALLAAQKEAQRLPQATTTSPFPSSSSTQSPTSQNRGNRLKCDFCSRLGHSEAKCFLREKLMNQIASPSSSAASPVSTSPQTTPQPTSNTAQSAQVATASALSSVIQSQSHSSWNADTGASAHMTFNHHWMHHMKPYRTPIHLADGSVLYSEGIGSVRFISEVNGRKMGPLEFTNVLYVPFLSTN